jgi:hypothetical protein
MNSTVLKKFVSSTAWSFISAVATKVSVVITGILVARVLGAQSFGEYGLIQSAIVMLANVAAQATTTATAKHIGQFKESSPEKTGRGIALTLTFSVFFSAIFPALLLQRYLGRRQPERGVADCIEHHHLHHSVGVDPRLPDRLGAIPVDCDDQRNHRDGRDPGDVFPDHPVPAQRRAAGVGRFPIADRVFQRTGLLENTQGPEHHAELHRCDD